MNNVFEEVMAKLVSIDEIKYVNWDIGQMNGYYLRPSVTFPCVLISFPNLDFEDMSNATQMGSVAMQLKIVTQALSQTSNLTPALVRAKGNEIWEIEKLIHKKLHTQDGNSFNSMSRVKIQIEPREDGYNVLNTFYAFAKEDYNAEPVTHMVSPMSVEVIPEIVLPANSCPNCPDGIEIAMMHYINGIRITGISTASLRVEFAGAVFINNATNAVPTYTFSDGNTTSSINIGDAKTINVSNVTNGTYIGYILSSLGAKYEFEYIVNNGTIAHHQQDWQCAIATDLDCQIAPVNNYSIDIEGNATNNYLRVGMKVNAIEIISQGFATNKFELVVHDILNQTNDIETIVYTPNSQLSNKAILNIQCIS